MSRIKIDMPAHYTFSTVLPIRISDINHAGHLGNDSVVSLIHEARIQFLKQYQYGELEVEGFGIIMTDSAVIYKAEGFHSDQIQIDIAIGEFNKYGCDIFYLLSNHQTAVEIAHAKTGIVFFDYDERKVVSVPEKFRSKFVKEAE
ncbi:MAG: thioesterase family protein [Halopseudomonas sp.]